MVLALIMKVNNVSFNNERLKKIFNRSILLSISLFIKNYERLEEIGSLR